MTALRSKRIASMAIGARPMKSAAISAGNAYSIFRTAAPSRFKAGTDKKSGPLLYSFTRAATPTASTFMRELLRSSCPVREDVPHLLES